MEKAQCQTQDVFSVLSLESCKDRNEIQKQITQNWSDIKQQLSFIGRYAAKDRLAEAISIFSEARKSRFLRRRTPKYGTMNKGFTDEELQKFFSIIDDKRFHLLFSFQAVLGLRIGEAVKVHIKDINLKTRELRIETEKARTLNFLLIPEQLFNMTLDYIQDFETQIVKAKGYLFFVEDHHMSVSCARQAFERYIQKARLYDVYGYSNDARPRTLTRLTTHSLRHYAITNHAKKNNGNVVLTNKFARHLRLQTTMVYIYTSKDELYRSIERAQDNELLERIKRMQNK
ncbi:site-specific integrase [Candidatus Micrarchaeota archaeon]|nr:site-specific integrase [Candidatus Micrarchaeota archaeon]